MLYLAALFMPVVALSWTRHVWWTVIAVVSLPLCFILIGLPFAIAAWVYGFVAVHRYYAEQTIALVDRRIAVSG